MASTLLGATVNIDNTAIERSYSILLLSCFIRLLVFDSAVLHKASSISALEVLNYCTLC